MSLTEFMHSRAAATPRQPAGPAISQKHAARIAELCTSAGVPQVAPALIAEAAPLAEIEKLLGAHRVVRNAEPEEIEELQQEAAQLVGRLLTPWDRAFAAAAKPREGVVGYIVSRRG